jgi:hypothetical protein
MLGCKGRGGSLVPQNMHPSSHLPMTSMNFDLQDLSPPRPAIVCVPMYLGHAEPCLGPWDRARGGQPAGRLPRHTPPLEKGRDVIAVAT